LTLGNGVKSPTLSKRYLAEIDPVTGAHARARGRASGVDARDGDRVRLTGRRPLKSNGATLRQARGAVQRLREAGAKEQNAGR
jgi:hypothetical protein